MASAAARSSVVTSTPLSERSSGMSVIVSERKCGLETTGLPLGEMRSAETVGSVRTISSEERALVLRLFESATCGIECQIMSN